MVKKLGKNMGKQMMRLNDLISANHLVILLGLCLGFGMVGCNESVKVTLDSVTHDYYAHRYQQALQGATKLRSQLQGDQRTQAGFIAGLSAFQLGDKNKAVSYLGQLTHDKDPHINGSANGTLGLIYLERGDDTNALKHFRQATAKLKGNNKAQACFYQAVVEQKMGWWTSSKQTLKTARINVTDSILRSLIQQRLNASAFTIQVGAYRNRSTAEKRAALMRNRAKSAGVSLPRVVPSTTAGNQSLYLVHLGRFNQYVHATTAKRKLGQRDAIVVVR